MLNIQGFEYEQEQEQGTGMHTGKMYLVHEAAHG